MDFGLLRIPVPEFDHRAFREALINAFSHRDYTMLQMTRVLIDDDGLTISNPGSFIEGVDLKNLINADPHGRNPALADALKRIGLAERTGRGIDRIFEGSIVYGRPLPDYTESNDSSVKVFISRGLPDLSFYRMIKEEQSKSGNFLSINQLLILFLLHVHKKLSLAGLYDLTNIAIPKLESVLLRLHEFGLVEVVDNGRSRVFVLGDRTGRAENVSVKNVRKGTAKKESQVDIVLALSKKQDTITARDITILLGINMTQARYLLGKLIEQKKLVKEGTSRNMVYRFID